MSMKHESAGYPNRRPYLSPSGNRRQRSIPDRITRYYVPLAVLESTSRFMRRFGEERRECYVWWGGYFTSEGEGYVLTALCPEIQSEFGHIHLGNRELTVLHMQLRTLDQILLVELHSHPPGAGGQNSVDAAHPAATYRGFISMVVPDFASPELHDLRNVYVYEYIDRNQWRELEPAETQNRFVIEESSIIVTV